MSASLLDVNVLVALFDPDHIHHEAAHRWFTKGRVEGWATCPLTENGLVRVLSNPGYHAVPMLAAQVVERLVELCSLPGHQFWPDEISLRDRALFPERAPFSARQVTDLYLLALAVRRGGQLVTFDRSIPVAAVNGAKAANLTILSA